MKRKRKKYAKEEVLVRLGNALQAGICVDQSFVYCEYVARCALQVVTGRINLVYRGQVL